MKYTNFTITILDKEFSTPMQFGAHKINFKRFGIVEMSNDGKVTATAELSSLPQLHLETFEYYLNELKYLLEEFKNYDIDASALNYTKTFFGLLPLPLKKCSTPVLFCFESLLLSMLRPPEVELSKNNFNINGLYIPSVSNNIPSEETLKIKIARQRLEQDISCIKNILTKRPLTALRLDANKALPLASLKKLQNEFQKNIEYFEEPFENYAQYQALENSPIAIDESLHLFIQDHSPPKCIKALIIKPNVTLSISGTINLILKYKGSLKIVISSSFEAYHGMKVLASLALLQNNYKKTAAGLGTNVFFRDHSGLFCPLKEKAYLIRP